MKIKYVLPMLTGLALASCSQDEDFVGNAQKSDFSPITFAVTMEGEDASTRAWQDDTDDGKFDWFKFEEGKELLSLWNGMTASTTAWTKIGSNAVFEGVGNEDGVVEFKTRSLVSKGTAIMVYPADTTFATTGTTLKVKIPDVQTAATTQAIPYVSDLMTIGNYNSTTGANNTAGYGRKYDVALRQAAGLLTIKLAPTATVDFTALGVDPIEYTEVAITNGSTTLFPTAIVVKPTDTDSPVKANGDGKYDHFGKAAGISGDATKVAEITSTDIRKNEFVNFVVAPFAAATVDNNASIKVSTTYGSVTVANNPSAAAGEVGPLQNTEADQGVNLAANLKNALEATWKKAVDGKYKTSGNANVGAIVRRTLTLDMSKLDMNGTVVTSSVQLVNLLKVYNALQIEGAVKLVLKGDGENNEFELTGEALQALKEYNNADMVNLDVTTNSVKIVLADENATLAALADKSVNFINGATDNAATAEAILKEGLAWTLDQSYNGSKDAVTATAKVSKVVNRGTLTYTNASGSAVAAAVELELAKGSMSFAANSVLGAFTAEKDTEIKVTAGQTITLAGVTTLNGSVENKGIISAKAAVVNNGEIDNQFEVSVISGGSYSFTNYGVIKNNGKNAVTYITENGNGTDKSGRIVLTNRNDEVSVNGNKGYIVYKMSTANEDGEYVYETKTGDVFNWLVIDASAATLPSVILNNDVTYLTIKGNPAVVTTNGTITVTDLFVESAMRLLGSNKIAATSVYVVDYILHAGGLTGNQKKEYTSGVEGEDTDTETYKNGVIRTVSGS